MAYAAFGGGTGLAASIAVFTRIFGPFRDLLVIASVILLGIAHYYYWRRWQPSGITPTKVILWASTTLTLILISVFYVWGTLLARAF